MILDFCSRGPVNGNNDEEIKLPQMRESRHRGNPELVAQFRDGKIKP